MAFTTDLTYLRRLALEKTAALPADDPKVLRVLQVLQRKRAVVAPSVPRAHAVPLPADSARAPARPTESGVTVPVSYVTSTASHEARDQEVARILKGFKDARNRKKTGGDYLASTYGSKENLIKVMRLFDVPGAYSDADPAKELGNMLYNHLVTNGVVPPKAVAVV